MKLYTTTATFLLFSLHNHYRHISIVFSPPPLPPQFYCFPSNTTTATFLLFPLHHRHHHRHNSIFFPPPPPPHFYCFPSTTTTATFLLFSLHHQNPPPPHFYCFPSSSFSLSSSSSTFSFFLLFPLQVWPFRSFRLDFGLFGISTENDRNEEEEDEGKQ